MKGCAVCYKAYFHVSGLKTRMRRAANVEAER